MRKLAPVQYCGIHDCTDLARFVLITEGTRVPICESHIEGMSWADEYVAHGSMDFCYWHLNTYCTEREHMGEEAENMEIGFQYEED